MTEETRSINSIPEGAPHVGDFVVGTQGGQAKRFPWSLFDPSAVQQQKEDELAEIDQRLLTAQQQAQSASVDAAQVAQDRIATAADRAQTEQDRVATAGDRVQTGLDRIQTGADRAGSDNAAMLATSALLSAIGAASLAASMALAASSVAQQDMSGAVGAALHRSPNAVAATALYDTSKDSDPGWVLRCANTSWENEVLQGTWIPGNYVSGIPSETIARAVGGTLGSELLPDATNSANWVPNANTTISTVGGKLRVLASGGGFAGASRAIATVAGQLYVVTARRIGDQTAAGTTIQGGITAGAAVGGSTLLNGIIGATPGISGTFLFVASGATTYIGVQPNAGVTGSLCDFDSISCKQATALAPSGSYYQLATDGKYYRLWRNTIANPLDLSQASWTKANVTPTYNAIANPVDGLLNAALFVDNATNGAHGFSGTPTITNVPAGASVYVKAYGNLQRVALGLENGGGAYAFFDLAGASVGTSTGNSGAMEVAAGISITALGSGWYKITNGYNGAASGRLFVYSCQGATNTVSYVGDGLSGFYAYLPHYELGASTAGAAIAPEAKTVTDTSQTEVFRGNKRQFPRMAGIVAEASRVVIYDLLEPGRPMWMVFVGASNALVQAATPTGIAAIGGKLLVTQGAGSGLHVIDFAKDSGQWYLGTGMFAFRDNIAKRNAASGSDLVNSAAVLPTNTTNAVAVCVMPDAPVDPVTGLQVPTIAVAMGSGVSVIKHDGTVVSSAASGAFTSVAITPHLLSATVVGAWYYAVKPSTLGATFSLTQINAGANQLYPGGTMTGHLNPRREMVGSRYSVTPRFVLTRLNESTPTVSLNAQITDTHNTGWMVGDIRRAWLCDVDAGVTSGAEQVTNGTFDTDISGWANSTLYTAGTTSWDPAGRLKVTAPAGGGAIGAYQAFNNLVAGAVYKLTFDGTGGVDVMGKVGSEGNNYVNGLGNGGTFVAPVGALYLTFRNASAAPNAVITFDNISLKRVVEDRSYKAKPITVFGTLTKTAVAAAAQLIAYSGFSATNYLQEAYSADLDMGTGAWSVSALAGMVAAGTTVTVPAGAAVLSGGVTQYLTLSNFPATAVPMTMNTTEWTKGLGWSASAAGTVASDGTQGGTSDLTWATGTNRTPGFGVVRRWTIVVTALSGPVSVYPSHAAPFTITVPGTYTALGGNWSGGGNHIIRVNGGITCSLSVTMDDLKIACILDRSAATGSYYKLGVNAVGYLIGEVWDGTTLRQVASAASYIGVGLIKPELIYDTSGSLTLKVNGNPTPVGQTTGAPLLTLNNASAVATVGNARTPDAAFPGSIAMVKVSATAPTADQSAWMWEQEKQMLQPGAQVTLPDAGAVTDLDYDTQEGKWKAVSAVIESSFVGLVRTSSAPVNAGSFTKVSHKSGIKLLARSTTNPGVDVSMPAQNLKEELLRRADDAKAAARPTSLKDWTGGFTATTAVGSALLTSVANLTVPDGCTVRGAAVTGTGVPAGTKILDYTGTTIQLSAAITTGAGAGVQINLLSFPLPTGMELVVPRVGGTVKQEGATKDFTRAFDGFREAPLWPTGSPPGNTAWVQTEVRRMAT